MGVCNKKTFFYYCFYEVKMDKRLLDILVCPLCKGPLIYVGAAKEIVCKFDRIAFPIRDDIPVMIEQEARILTTDECKHIST